MEGKVTGGVVKPATGSKQARDHAVTPAAGARGEEYGCSNACAVSAGGVWSDSTHINRIP